MADDERKAKLDLTISSVTPERLEQTRAEVQKLSTSNKPPKIIEAAPSEPPVEEEAPISEATERLKKLDLIQDVQLILVDRYRQGAKVLWVAIGLISLGLFGLVGILIKNFQLYDHVAALQTEQEKLVERGAQIERKTDETKAKVDETNAKVDQTNAKVDQAVESAPKIEIDDAGKAKVVLPVKTSEPISFKKRNPPPGPTTSASASAPPLKVPTIATQVPIPSQLPVEPKKF